MGVNDRRLRVVGGVGRAVEVVSEVVEVVRVQAGGVVGGALWGG